MDLSQTQLDQIKTEHNNVVFRQGRGEDLSFLDDATASLVTCAQGLHWFNREEFYKELDRVLKPHGVLAAYGYGRVSLDNQEATQHVLKVTSLY